MSTGRHRLPKSASRNGNTALGDVREPCQVRDALHRVADGTQCAADSVSQEQERNDGDHGDESENECVFGKALAAIIVADWSGEERKLGE